MQAATDGESAAGLIYYVFDLLHLDGQDLQLKPLLERKERLAEIMKGTPVRELARLAARLKPLATDRMPLDAAAADEPLRIAARSLARALGAAGARRQGHLSRMDGRRPASAGRLSGAAGGQAGGGGAA